MTTERHLDVISLGRLALDLYPQQRGVRAEHATSFARSLGGASAQIAFGCARLGLRTAMLSRVGDDGAGRFLIDTLAAEGCDVSHIAVDHERITALGLAGALDHDSAPHARYRETCADMAIDDHDVAEDFLRTSHVLVIAGAPLSTATTDRVSSLALERARRNAVRTVMDLAGDRATAHVQSLLHRCDLVVGTREDLQSAGGSADLVQALRAIRGLTAATLVLRQGDGCAVIDGDVPARIEDALVIAGWPNEVTAEGVNELGAGEGFLAGLLKGWLSGLDWRGTARLANACGALVAARRAGSSAMPTAAELEHVMSGAGPGGSPVRLDADPELARLHRVTPRRKPWDDLCIVDIDLRAAYFELARAAGAPESRLLPLNHLLTRAVAETEQALSLQGHIGALVDDGGISAAGRGWWLGRPVEIPGSSPLELEGGRSIGARLVAWPSDHVVSCAVSFHPDEPVDDRLEQETQLAALYQAVLVSGHELLLEVMPSDRLPCDGDTIVRALKRLYNIGIFPEWWKLAALSAATWHSIDDLIAARDPYCRGVLVSPEGDPEPAFRAAAASQSCRGLFVGRTSLHEPSAAWLSGAIDDDTLVACVRAIIVRQIQAWQRARRMPHRAEAT